MGRIGLGSQSIHLVCHMQQNMEKLLIGCQSCQNSECSNELVLKEAVVPMGWMYLDGGQDQVCSQHPTATGKYTVLG